MENHAQKYKKRNLSLIATDLRIRNLLTCSKKKKGARPSSVESVILFMILPENDLSYSQLILLTVFYFIA